MWGKKGENWYLYQHRSQFNMSFMLALSMEKIEGIMGTYSTFSAKWFEYFITNLFKNRKENCIIIMDNAKIHVAKIIDEYWGK